MRGHDILHGIACPIGADLCFLVSHFIMRADISEDYIKLVYVFTDKEASGNILKRGFVGPVNFSQNTEVALSQHNSPEWHFRNSTNYPPSTLSTIHESDNFVTTSVGFLVAVVDWKGAPSRSYKAPSGNAVLTCMKGSGNILPLVCFDASIRKNDIIRRLVNGFSRILNDFFHSVPVDFGLDPANAMKKIKSDSSVAHDQAFTYPVHDALIRQDNAGGNEQSSTKYGAQALRGIMPGLSSSPMERSHQDLYR